MTERVSSLDQLAFHDGEDVLVTHLNGKERLWLFQTETFSRATFHSDRVEFTLLDENGNDYEHAKAIDQRHKDPYIRSLGDVAYCSAVAFENEDWLWNKISVPLPEIIEIFRDSHLAHLGANTFTFDVAEGDGEDGEFSLDTIMEALVNKNFLIGANAGYFVHDIEDHSMGMAAIDRICMDTLRDLAEYSRTLALSKPATARHLQICIAHNLDYYSFYKNFLAKMANPHIDPILSHVARVADRYNGDARSSVRAIITENGYRLNPNKKVLRKYETAQYYQNAVSALESPTS